MPAPSLSEALTRAAERALPSVASVWTLRVRAGAASPDSGYYHHGSSGVVLDRNGHIVTSDHVVANAARVAVAVAGVTRTAEVVGRDPATDLALLRIADPPKDLVPISVSSSGAPRVGDVVVALGNPLSAGPSATMGIVSAVGRSDVGHSEIEHFVQTDASINLGNSGGALVNLDGELVGINTAVFASGSPGGGAGLAIPASIVSRAISALRAHGQAQWGYAGIEVQAVDAPLARVLGISEVGTAIVTVLHEDGPATESGLAVGDVIVRVDGERPESAGALRYGIALKKPGTVAHLDVARAGREMSFDVKLERTPVHPPPATPSRAALPLGGMEVGGGVRADMKGGGLPVKSVAPGSPAALAGIRAGDVLVLVSGKPMRQEGDLRDAWDQRADPSKGVVVQLRRGPAVKFIALEPD